MLELPVPIAVLIVAWYYYIKIDIRCQYFIRYPLYVITELIRLRMLFIVRSINSTEILFYTFVILFSNSSNDSTVICLRIASPSNSFFTIWNIFSIGLRSGERGGMTCISASMCSRAFIATLLVGQGQENSQYNSFPTCNSDHHMNSSSASKFLWTFCCNLQSLALLSPNSRLRGNCCIEGVIFVYKWDTIQVKCDFVAKVISITSQAILYRIPSKTQTSFYF